MKKPLLISLLAGLLLIILTFVLYVFLPVFNFTFSVEDNKSVLHRAPFGDDVLFKRLLNPPPVYDIFTAEVNNVENSSRGLWTYDETLVATSNKIAHSYIKAKGGRPLKDEHGYFIGHNVFYPPIKKHFVFHVVKTNLRPIVWWEEVKDPPNTGR